MENITRPEPVNSQRRPRHASLSLQFDQPNIINTFPLNWGKKKAWNVLKELILDVPGGVGVQWGLDLAGTILTEWGFSVHEMEVLLEVGISENHCWIFDLATTLDRVAEIINIDSIFHQAGDNFPDLQKSCISLVKKGRSDLGYSQAQWIGESIWELKELL